MKSNEIINILLDLAAFGTDEKEKEALTEAVEAVKMDRDLTMVVRCKECKNHHDNGGKCLNYIQYGADGYCSKGERT